jgi:hypothetical protein
MFIGPDMVMAQIGKDPDLEGNPRRPVQHQPLGGHFHDHAVAANLHHLRKIFVDGVGFRGGIGRRNLFLPDNRLNSADQPHLVSHVLQDGFDHIGGGGLAFGSGDADDLQFFRRIAEICGGHEGKPIAGILHPYDGHMPGHIHLFFHNQGRSALLCNLPGKSVAVRDRPADADKNRPLLHLPGIVDQCGDLRLVTALYRFVF